MKIIFIEILNMSIMASIVACAVVLLRLLLKKVPKVYSYALWAVVLFRLVCPFTFESAYSLMPAGPNTVPQDIIYMQIPDIQSSIPPINTTLNESINQSSVPVRSVNPISILFEAAAFIWAGGILILLGYGIISYMRLKRRMETAVLIRDNIYETDRITTPFVLGFIKPKIYLPINAGELDYILKHEQTHIRRCDHLIKPIGFFALALHWFNPIIWLSYFLMCKDMEMSCDESVLKHSRNDIRKNYSGSLLNLSVKQNGLLSPLAFGESNTRARVKNVLQYRKQTLWISIMAVIVVLIFTTGFAADQVQSFDYDKTWLEATQFSTWETDPYKISEIAFYHYFTAFSNNKVPDEYRYTDFSILNMRLDTGDEQEFTVFFDSVYTRYTPGDGIAQDNGTFIIQDGFYEFRIKNLGGNEYQIVSVDKGQEDKPSDIRTPNSPYNPEQDMEQNTSNTPNNMEQDPEQNISYDYAKILSGDLSELNRVWINGKEEVLTLKADGTLYHGIDINDIYVEDGKIYQQKAIDFAAQEDGSYTWSVILENYDGPYGFAVWLYPIGVEVYAYDEHIPTDTTKVRLYVGHDFQPDMTGEIYY